MKSSQHPTPATSGSLPASKACCNNLAKSSNWSLKACPSLPGVAKGVFEGTKIHRTQRTTRNFLKVKQTSKKRLVRNSNQNSRVIWGSRDICWPGNFFVHLFFGCCTYSPTGCQRKWVESLGINPHIQQLRDPILYLDAKNARIPKVFFKKKSAL